MKQGFIYINNNILSTLFAISADEQARGLMYINPPTPIMTFVYENPKINKFWMANTKAPLDIVFCHKGQVSQICYGEPHSISTIGDDKYSDLIVELPYGTVDTMGIKIGNIVGLVKPTVEEFNKIFAKKSFC